MIGEGTRLREWSIFAHKVASHIVNYTVPQYGDKGSDQADDFTVEDCAQHIKRYANRVGKNSRGHAEQLRDFLKIAHYAQMAHDKYLEAYNNEKE